VGGIILYGWMLLRFQKEEKKEVAEIGNEEILLHFCINYNRKNFIDIKLQKCNSHPQ
jgi:hypothetical protein